MDGFYAHLSRCDGQFYLSPSSTHEDAKLLANTFQERESVVFSKRTKKILNGVGFVLATSVFFKLCDDLRLVGVTQRWGIEDCLQFRVRLED